MPLKSVNQLCQYIGLLERLGNPLIYQFFLWLQIFNISDLWLSNSFGLLWLWLIFPPYIVYKIYHTPLLIFTTSFHDFPFQYRINTKFLFDFPYVVRQTSFMSIYFMCEATFVIVISLFERTLRWTNIHFFYYSDCYYYCSDYVFQPYTLHTLFDIFPWRGSLFS